MSATGAEGDRPLCAYECDSPPFDLGRKKVPIQEPPGNSAFRQLALGPGGFTSARAVRNPAPVGAE